MQQPTKEKAATLSGTRKRVLDCIPFDEWIAVPDLCKAMANVDNVLHDRSTVARICHGLAKSNFVELRQRNKDQKVRRVPLYEKPERRITVDILEKLDNAQLALIDVQEKLGEAQNEIKRLRAGDPELQQFKEKYLKLRELLK